MSDSRKQRGAEMTLTGVGIRFICQSPEAKPSPLLGEDMSRSCQLAVNSGLTDLLVDLARLRPAPSGAHTPLPSSGQVYLSFATASAVSELRVKTL